ncbi:oligosaccharide flippase family protein [Tenacibaculum sp. IB213877]|uniref:oligosaccharide flippase family protein n=1 Tax=Tenacibaculum sp. IB213877 TaxID=3097351 RepID=UPI002A59D13B|nr:oligosaccharide flippase family protein [Tenacibaculum sp. IB213877]MDY0780092.1 oligosaccharide flippase family protein [Tenacibaculum sp. IB213877]
MKLIYNYIHNFLNRAGSYVFLATVLSRILSFLASWIAVQFIENKALGEVLYAWTIISFLIPFVGMGLPQSLIRYGAIENSSESKNDLLNFVIRNGTFASIFLTFLIAVFGLLFPFTIKNTQIFLPLLSLSFVPFFLFETIKIQLRLQHQNKKYSLIEISYNIALVILVLILSFIYKEMGYAFALVLAPSLVSILFFKEIGINHFKRNNQLTVKPKELWKYGFFGGLSNVATILLFSIDLLLIGNILMNSELVTAYKYVSLIPFSVLFIPRVFITTDFVTFTEQILNKNYIFNYIKSYILLFLMISGLFVLITFFFSEELLSLFDSDFIKFSDSFQILCIGVCGILIFRGLFGNLLSSIGLVKINYYISLSALILNYISNQFLIPKYGIKGAALTSAILMWLTGIASFILFFIFYKKLPFKKL